MIKESKMASFAKTSSKNHSDMDQALDGLGFSYLDGVPFRLDPRIEAVNNYDLSRVEAILARPPPGIGLSEHCTSLLSNLGKVEKQVLDQLKAIDDEKKAKAEKEAKELKELEERREARRKAVQEELEKAENEKQEAKEKLEAEKKSDEGEQNETSNKNGDGSNVESSAPETPSDEASEASTIPAVPTPTTQSPPLPTPVQQQQQPVLEPLRPNINFSEFEAESDPFERAELQTLNDLQELAAVLQTTSQPSGFATSMSYSNASQQPQQQQQSTTTTYPYYQHPLPQHQPHQLNQFYYQQQQQQQVPRPFFPGIRSFRPI